LHTRPFLASPDRVKGTDATSLAPVTARAGFVAGACGNDPDVNAEVAQLIDIHSAAGRRFEAAGVRSFVREQGRGPDVVLLHGVPSSSFLYRKVIPRLADQGVRAIAFDFPGLGLADRPRGFDYSWSGLASWLGEAIDALELDRCHLVVHDIGGPIGCEWAVRNPDRVLSLTALNTDLSPATFRRPWTMHPFSIRGVGELWLRGTPKAVFAALFRLQGLGDRTAMSAGEIYVYRELLMRLDRGRAFLEIMRGFELTDEKDRLLADGLADRSYPARVIWGERDPALGLDHLARVQRVLGVDDPVLLPAKHFLQEDQAGPLAYAIADQVAPLG
jgi:pimeloyl-ACP methyl ester carboxylesterase